MRARRGRSRWAWTPAVAGLLALLALAPASPDLEPSPASAGIPKPKRHPYFGYNETWSGNPRKLARAARGGSDIARVVIGWSDVERQPGIFRWRRYDRLNRRIEAGGMRPLWVISDAPCWARDVSPERCREQGLIAHPPSPAHDQEFGAFAAQIAQRYPRAVAIEAWNEPNLWSFWRPRPEPRRAATLTALANAYVDAVNPSMPVLLGGLSPVLEPVEGEQIPYKNFLRQVYEAVGPGQWDGVAIHPFPRFLRSARYLRDIEAHLRRVRDVLRRSEAAGTPIWVTEIGLSTEGLRPYSRTQQATGLVRIYRALANMPDVPAVVVHRLVDQEKSVKTAEAGWGVIRHNGKRKPAFCALARERGVRCGRRR